MPSVCLQPQQAQPHAISSESNSSPCFPVQVGRHSTRTSEVQERRVQLKLKPQSRRRHLTLWDLVDTLRLGQVDKPCQGPVATLPQGLAYVLHQDLVGVCRPWPEDQEANFSICILFKERPGRGLEQGGTDLL